MTKRNCLKVLVMLGLALLSILLFTNNVEAANENPYALCIFTAYTANGEYIEAMGQGDYEYQELIFDMKNITSDFYYQFNTGINLGDTMTLEGLGNFTLSRTYIGQNDNATYYEYKSEIKNIETIKTGKQTYNYNFVDIDNNMPHPFTLDLGFVGEVDTEAVETLLESKGFYFDTEANMYRSPEFDRYINLENTNTVEVSETYVIETLEKHLNDNSIRLNYKGSNGDITGGTATIDIFKDNCYYGVICFDFNNILEIIVPDNVGNTDNAIMDYGINKIKNTLSIKDDISLNKISGYWYEINPYGSKAIVKKVEGTHIGNNIFVDNLDEGVTITVTEKQNATMENEIKNKGYTNILGSYELKLEGATKLTNPVDITFNVGTEHNGKTVYILHQKQNGTYENFEEKVVDGKVTITVSELSPFVLAIKENSSQVETPQDEEKQDEQTQNTTNIKDETPKTGNTNIATIVCSILSVLSAAGIAIVKKF